MSSAIPSPCGEETERSAALHSYGLLDTPRQQDFDDIARMASQVCGTPMAVVNLVDTRRQFFLAEVGLGVRETPLETSFCGRAILEQDMLVVPDARRDPRFDGNPLVHGEAGLKFYAGALLKTADGITIGTMCVLDTKPRELDEHQIEMLRFLARQAMTQMELRRSLAAQDRLLAQARASEARHRQILDSAVDFAMFTSDLGDEVTFWSVGAERVLGWSEGEMLGRSADVIFTPEDRATGAPDRERAAARGEGRALDERWHLRKDGARFWASGEMMPLMDDADRHVGYVKILRDRTEQRKSELQREELTQELAHRMKNTLAMVQAIATQTFRTAKSLDEGRDALSGRLIALGRAQDILTGSGADATEIRHLVDDALRPHRSGEGRIVVAGPSLELSPDQGLGLSLAIHELATNAAKYGALSVAEGEVWIDWTIAADRSFTFHWRESGGPVVETPTRTGFGSRLIERIVAPYFDGTGKLTFDPSGARFDLTGTIAPPCDRSPQQPRHRTP
ncbi:sensor histidine kinase [Aureimonas pseudogalii]|uniref:Blue-light-activated histidine kinase n=1 Tax=Aureimonas pseudogalii TaxID=1744844 RepID=A0A7W6H6D0_9HYPH|nr:HWE histidine kinase domain-containing protein [Aureimonas pseudogalii]MBB3999429.1 PAS domain S-box-containing protein [Aureimonas pseudogalii]